MKKLAYILVFVLLTGTHIANAQSSNTKVGTTAAEFLRIPVGARASAMSAMTASVNDPSAMVWNPSGLANITEREIMLEYTDWFVDFEHTFVGVAIPVGKGVAGVNVVALNMGEFDETTEEAQGKTGRTFNAYSLAVGASYAQYLIPQFTIGGTVKFIYERIFNSSASTVAFDIGTTYTTPFDDIKFGVSITNAGSKMQMDGNDLLVSSDQDQEGKGNYESDAKRVTDPFALPLMLRVGLAWDPIKEDNFRTTIAIDGNSPSNNVQSVSIGGEIALMEEQVFIRAGVPYIGQEDKTEKFNVGLGFNFKLENSFKIGINYAFHSYKDLGEVNKLSLLIYF